MASAYVTLDIASEAYPHVYLRYEILLDPNTRATYDRLGMDGMRPNVEPSPTMNEDFLESLFGGGLRFGFDFGMGGNGPRRRPRKGEDSIIPYNVTLEDLYNGKGVKMTMEREVVCNTCKG